MSAKYLDVLVFEYTSKWLPVIIVLKFTLLVITSKARYFHAPRFKTHVLKGTLNVIGPIRIIFFANLTYILGFCEKDF